MQDTSKLAETLSFDKISLEEKLSELKLKNQELLQVNEELSLDLQLIKEEQELNREEIIANLPLEQQAAAVMANNNQKLTEYNCNLCFVPIYHSALRKLRDVSISETQKFELRIQSLQNELALANTSITKLKELETLPLELKKSQSIIEDLKESLDDARNFESVVLKFIVLM